MIADDRERRRALDTAQSLIVEAPAGSGKTSLLTQRYLALLSIVERPESVVAMTFTRKAAAEMKERILNALQEASCNAPVANEYEQRTRELAIRALDQDRKKDWRLLFDPARLQIQTIDSLCAMLTRQMPVVSEFGGFGDVVEEASELYRLAARATLRELAEGDTESRELFHRVVLYFDSDIGAIEKQIARMLDLRDQWFSGEMVREGGLVEDFCNLLNRARDSLRQVFREEGVVDFTEITRAAIKALGTPDRPSDLLYRLDYRIEHLLVDEFQDTSHAQYDLIKALTAQWSDGDGHTLFLVGDPMQSIYRFRGAEVSFFLRTVKDRCLGSVRLEPIRLCVNFRSTPEIVNWVEEKFRPIMPEDDPKCGTVGFRACHASRGSEPAKPQLIPLIDDNGEREGAEVIRILGSIPDKSRAGILVRSRAHIATILPMLRDAGIPYQAIEIDALKEQQHVLDLLSLTRAILHLGDRVAWLACLRAPWCGLTLHDLSVLAENEPNRTIFDLVSDPEKIAALSPDGRRRVLRLHEILGAAVAKAGKVPLRGLVEQTWMALGGPAVLRYPNQHEDADTFLNLLEQSERGGLIRDFSLLEQRIELLYAKPRINPNCVQVMTIFEAKGLEFDVVIVPRLGAFTKPTERDLLAWCEHTDAEGNTIVFLAAQPRKRDQTAAYKRIEDEIKNREREELKRVFYVACTRARNQLYLIGNVKRNANGECRTPGKGTFLRLLWDSVQPEFDGARRRQISAAKAEITLPSRPKTILRRMPDDWRAPQFEASVRWQPALVHAVASAHKVTYEWVTGGGRCVGTVVHELLKRIAEQGSERWTEARLTATKPLIQSELLRLGVGRSEIRAASERAMRAITYTLASPRGKWVLQSHAESRSEWPIIGRIQDKLISGTIDRVFRDEQGRLWIVDFKTSEHEGGRLETFLNEEQRRYRDQLESYATLMSRLAPGPIWLGLYFPLLDGWREWQFQEEAALTV